MWEKWVSGWTNDKECTSAHCEGRRVSQRERRRAAAAGSVGRGDAAAARGRSGALASAAAVAAVATVATVTAVAVWRMDRRVGVREREGTVRALPRLVTNPEPMPIAANGSRATSVFSISDGGRAQKRRTNLYLKFLIGSPHFSMGSTKVVRALKLALPLFIAVSTQLRRPVKETMPNSLYAVLGVDAAASTEQIRSAYKSKARPMHAFLPKPRCPLREPLAATVCPPCLHCDGP